MICKKGGIIITEQRLSERCLYNVHLSDPERIYAGHKITQMVIYDVQNGTMLIEEPKETQIKGGNPWVKSVQFHL